MPNNNPQGINSFDHFGTESAYGAVKRLTDTTRAAPLAGDASAALNAPRRAQRRAVRGGRPQQGQPVAGPPPQNPQVSYPAALAAEWAEIAKTPGVSDLVLQVADEAQRG